MRLSRLLSRGATISRDVEAVQRGRVRQRVENRLIGRGISRVTRGWWRR